ncbi:MAG: IPT/TIG domain-containing protein, partial [Bifidobacteriaceae bacterium]|nr:IPT/TIG domain-containing protein [Bifidobacteriaceae bacterium]
MNRLFKIKNYLNFLFKNNKFIKTKFSPLNYKKIGVLGAICLFAITSFLTGSLLATGSTSQNPLPISFGGTGAKTQTLALTNLGINNIIDENSTNLTFPNAKAVYDYIKKALSQYISMDNINFALSLTNWSGGDLIIKKKNLNSVAANNKIKVGGVNCITTGQGYTSNSAANDNVPQIGCVLPKLSEGAHNVEISTNGGTNYSTYGQIVYQRTPSLTGCDTTSMQTFGAGATACKAAMKQGQVIVLNDTRNNQKYRIKKMPDGNVWMIDNLKLGSTTSSTALTPANTNISSNYTLSAINAANRNADPSSQSYCTSSGLLWTEAPGTLSGCG